MLFFFRKSSQLKKEKKASSGKQQAGTSSCSVSFLPVIADILKIQNTEMILTSIKLIVLTSQMFQMKWRGHQLPREIALI